MSQETINTIGQRLRAVRLKKGLTQDGVAEKAGISTNYYARIERGDTGISMDIFEKVVKALGVRSSAILPF